MRCKLGLHEWTRWEACDVILHRGVQKTLTVEGQTRACVRCGIEKVRKI